MLLAEETYKFVDRRIRSSFVKTIISWWVIESLIHLTFETQSGNDAGECIIRPR